MPERTYTLEFTASEVVGLEDRVRNEHCGTPDQHVDAYPLLMKLGSAFLAMTTDAAKLPGTINIALTVPELWLLRGLTKVDEKQSDDTMFGLKLKRKLWAALQTVHGVDEQIGLPVGDVTPTLSKSDVIEQMKKFPEDKYDG